MNHKLTLLFGMPRSGTTWIAKIFDSHPLTLYRHEPDSGGSLNEIPFFPDVKDWELYDERIQRFVDSLPGMDSLRISGSLPIFWKSYYSRTQRLIQHLGIAAGRTAEIIGREWRLPSSITGNLDKRPHIVWKSIESAGRIGVITRALPEARAILILRHPCAYIASVMTGESQQRFIDSDRSSEDYEVMEWLLAVSPNRLNTPSIEMMKTLAPVERLAWRWVLTNEKALRDTAGARNCAYVRYEDFCVEPFAKSWELLSFAGLKWDEQVSNFVKRSTSHHSKRYYSVFKDPVVSANKWQSELSPVDIERVMKIVRDSPLRALYDDQTVNGKIGNLSFNASENGSMWVKSVREKFNARAANVGGPQL